MFASITVGLWLGSMSSAQSR